MVRSHGRVYRGHRLLVARSSLFPVRVVDLLALRIYRSICPLWSRTNPEVSSTAQGSAAPGGRAGRAVIQRLSLKAHRPGGFSPNTCFWRWYSNSEGDLPENKLGC